MFVHVLGWLTVAAQLSVAGYVVRRLWDAGKETRSWLLPVRAPKVAGDLRLSSGSDYVGVV